jgi:DNA-binding NarL/FixJ family response regulator
MMAIEHDLEFAKEDRVSLRDGEARPRIMIVDDHPIVRLGLTAIITQSNAFDICGQAGDTAEALAVARRERPDQIILDLQIAGRGGLDLLSELLEEMPALQALVLSQHDETLYAERALRAGARGYLMKGEQLDGIVEALHAMRQGEIVLSKRMTARLLTRTFRALPEAAYGGLSNRELQIFLLIGAGRTTSQIAAELSLSPKTVGAHRENIKVKLGLETAAELEREAVTYVANNG